MPRVTKFGLYIVIIAIAFNNLQLAQLTKLPVLLEHFKEHRQRDANVTVMEFLAMHYWGQDINDNDDSRDKQLPFKDQTVIHFSSYYISFHHIEAPAPVAVFIHAKSPSLQVYYPDTVPGALFRPPQA
ncbi:hypothetical protein [Niastella sp. OAS944]|uniref:hypothetical protein n=1 Tax=Niastella sp. OAS944 TaxID=2664089 RepID=UPI00347A484E|nr:hypothetical protein [Chitinophagaceae bacterium OAS944]